MRKVKVKLLADSLYRGDKHKEGAVIEVDKRTADKWVGIKQATYDTKPKPKSTEK